MKKDEIALLGLAVITILGTIIVYKQNKVNKAQAELDKQIMAASQTFAEKLGIDSIPTINTVDTGAGKIS